MGICGMAPAPPDPIGAVVDAPLAPHPKGNIFVEAPAIRIGADGAPLVSSDPVPCDSVGEALGKGPSPEQGNRTSEGPSYCAGMKI